MYNRYRKYRDYQLSALNVGFASDLYECHTGSKGQRYKIRQRISRWQWITESRQFRGNSYRPTCCRGGWEECVVRVATKSTASGTTNQIFALAARSHGPLLLFICKVGLNYGGGKEVTVAANPATRVGPLCYLLTGSIIVLLLPWER